MLSRTILPGQSVGVKKYTPKRPPTKSMVVRKVVKKVTKKHIVKPIKIITPIKTIKAVKIEYPSKNIKKELKESTREKRTRKKIEEQKTALAVKNCPFCGKATYKDDGCNYMKCSKSEPKSNCPGEWCFADNKPKYKVIPGKESLGCCNDKSHNSH